MSLQACHRPWRVGMQRREDGSHTSNASYIQSLGGAQQSLTDMSDFKSEPWANADISVVRAMSALSPKPDMCGTKINVRFGPKEANIWIEMRAPRRWASEPRKQSCR